MAIPTSISPIINGTTYTCLRVNQDGNTSKYYYRSGGVEEVTINIRHSNVKASATRKSYDRHNLEMIYHHFPDPTTGLGELYRTEYTVLTNDVSDIDANFAFFASAYDVILDATMVTNLLAWQV
jgi:hypothetical protein